MERSETAYGFTDKHLKKIAAKHSPGYHATGMTIRFKRFDLSIGGVLTIPGDWDEN